MNECFDLVAAAYLLLTQKAPFSLQQNTSCAAKVVNFVVALDASAYQRYVENCSLVGMWDPLINLHTSLPLLQTQNSVLCLKKIQEELHTLVFKIKLG